MPTTSLSLSVTYKSHMQSSPQQSSQEKEVIASTLPLGVIYKVQTPSGPQQIKEKDHCSIFQCLSYLQIADVKQYSTNWGKQKKKKEVTGTVQPFWVSYILQMPKVNNIQAQSNENNYCSFVSKGKIRMTDSKQFTTNREKKRGEPPQHVQFLSY